MAAEVAAWQKRNFGGSSSALGSAVAAWRRRRQRNVGGSSVVLGEALAAGAAWQAAQQQQGRGGMC